MLGTPQPYRSPSNWFERKPGKGSDLWALGCTLFNIRSGGVDLVETFMGASADQCISEIQDFLGPLPERWNKLYFDEFEAPRPRDELTHEELAEFERKWELQPFSQDPPKYTLRDFAIRIVDDYHCPPRPEDRKPGEKAEKITLYNDHSSLYSVEDPGPPVINTPAEEGECLGDLLIQLMKDEPEEQTPADQLINHPWVTNDFPDNLPGKDAPPLFRSIWGEQY